MTDRQRRKARVKRWVKRRKKYSARLTLAEPIGRPVPGDLNGSPTASEPTSGRVRDQGEGIGRGSRSTQQHALSYLPHALIETPDAEARLVGSAIGRRNPCILCQVTVPSFGIFTPLSGRSPSFGGDHSTIYWICERCLHSRGSTDRIEAILKSLPWYQAAR